MTKILYVIIGVLLTAVAYLMLSNSQKNSVISELKSISQTHTSQIVVKRDTVFITKWQAGKTIYVHGETPAGDPVPRYSAVYDTVVTDSSMGLTVKVAFSSADSTFGIEPYVWWQCPETVRTEIIMDTVYVEKPLEWYQKPAFTGVVGGIIGLAVGVIF